MKRQKEEGTSWQNLQQRRLLSLQAKDWSDKEANFWDWCEELVIVQEQYRV